MQVTATRSSITTVHDTERRSGRKRTSRAYYSDSEEQQRPQLSPAKETSSKKDSSNGGSGDARQQRSRRSETTQERNNSIPRANDNDELLSLHKDLLSKLPNAPIATNCYEEESAWRFHNPAFPSSDNSQQGEQLTIVRDESMIPSLRPPVASEDLPPLPPPPPLPSFPNTGFCQWSFDEESRVLYANFRGVSSTTTNVKLEDETFLLRMMERDDITVISDGLAYEISTSL